MGNLRACLAVAMLALAACGSDHAKPDASIVLIDSPTPDSKVFEDAPPPSYDLSCLNGTPPTMAADPITIAGSTVELSQSAGAVPNVAIDVFKNGSNTPIGTATSNAMGEFATGNIDTGGEPIDGYVRAKAPPADPQDPQSLPLYRTTYMYPPSVVATSLTDVPVLLIPTATFDQLAGVLGQDDENNGALFFAVTDCSSLATQTLIAEATVQVQQNGADVGKKFGLDFLDPRLAGTYLFLDVPDGPAQIRVSYNGMNFPVRTVVAHKKPSGPNEVGTLTVTVVRPGP